MVTVRYGMTGLPPSADYVDKTIGQIRALVQDDPRLNMAPGCRVLINGQGVSEDYVCQSGDLVTFVRPSGEKGA